MKEIYLDYSATTPVKKEVLESMMPFFTEEYGNPSSLYKKGRTAKEHIATARKQVADLIGASENGIFFTSGGTEADNWAVKGIAEARKNKGNHIITSKIEHHALLHTCEYLEKQGYEVTYLSVDKDGLIDLQELKDAIKPTTILISIMFVNNEVGTIQPIKEIGAIAKEHDIVFHTDAVQAIGNVEIDVQDMNIDILSMSSHKIYGPKGIGALYLNRRINLPNYLHGGQQEFKKRSGTENVPGIIGFGKAAELAKKNLSEHTAHLTELRDYFIQSIMGNIEGVRLNGHPEKRHPGNINITISSVEGETTLLFLDINGIYASSGSACSSSSFEASHVLQALGIPLEDALSSVRFTVGDFTTKEDIDYTIETLKKLAEKYRSFSPLYNKKG
jgi:cysteine desulfurase